MMRLFIMTLGAVTLVVSSAFAMDLNSARKAGLVGEKLDGYAAVVKAQAGVADLVNQVNNGRKAEYERISKQNGQPVNVVSKLAAEQIIKGLPAGALYQGPDGSWRKK